MSVHSSMTAEQIDAAREIDILEIAQRYGALKRAGTSESVGPCPVCGGKDRFSVHTRTRLALPGLRQRRRRHQSHPAP
jgi:phage/plasmid primase-like uncharacterized protein